MCIPHALAVCHAKATGGNSHEACSECRRSREGICKAERRIRDARKLEARARAALRKYMGRSSKVLQINGNPWRKQDVLKGG